MGSKTSNRFGLYLWTCWYNWTRSRAAQVSFGPPRAMSKLVDFVGTGGLHDWEGCSAIVKKDFWRGKVLFFVNAKKSTRTH